MKTSNKLLIGLLTAILMIMSAIFIDLRLFGLHGEERFTKNYSEDFPVDNFSHVIIENAGMIEITGADKNYIHFQTISDTLKSTIQYNMVSDTLKITGNQFTRFSNYTLFTNSVIESLTIKGSEVHFSALKQDSLRVEVVNGSLNSYGSDSIKISLLKHLSINQVNSTINLENIKIDSLDIEMQKSNSRFAMGIIHINAKLQSESELHLHDAENLNLVKDISSRVNFW